MVFPELALCGYPPQDLLLYPRFIVAMDEQLQRIIAASQGIALVVGVVRAEGDLLYNSAAAISITLT